MDGNTDESCLTNGALKISNVADCKIADKTMLWYPTRKNRNKSKQIINGYGGHSTLRAVHWNMESKYWINKTHEIQIMVDDIKLYVECISEANIFHDDQEHQLKIQGYTLHLTKSIKTLNYCRLAMLVRDGTDVHILEEYMDTVTPSFWLKLPYKGRKNVFICSVYREHRYLNQPKPNTTGVDTLQWGWWNHFINQWLKASNKAEIILLGDTNLDHFKLNDPKAINIPMVDQVKDIFLFFN